MVDQATLERSRRAGQQQKKAAQHDAKAATKAANRVRDRGDNHPGAAAAYDQASFDQSPYDHSLFEDLETPWSGAGQANDRDLLNTFLIGLLEQAINKALRKDVAALDALRAFAGRIFRIKTYQPYAVFYCQFSDEGVSLLSQYDGEVDARVQAPAGKLLMLLLQQDSELKRDDFEIKILGDREVVEQVLNILKTYDTWRWVRQFWLEWFPGATDFPDVMAKLQAQAPQWWSALQAVPATTQDLLVELKHLSETQTQMLSEIKALRAAYAQGQTKLSVVQWLGVVLILVGFFWFGAHLLP